MMPYTVRILGVEVRHFRPPVAFRTPIGTAAPLKNPGILNGMAKLRALLEQVCYDHEISVAVVTGRRQLRRIVTVRRAFAVEARRMGFTVTMIGHILNRDHSTVVLLTK